MPSWIRARTCDLCDDLVVFNRRPDALQRRDRTLGDQEERMDRSVFRRYVVDDDIGCLRSEQRIHNAILRRRKDGIEAKLDDRARCSRDPVDVLNNVLLPAMKEVGDKFGAGELISAVRAAVGRSDEKGRRPSRAISGQS